MIRMTGLEAIAYAIEHDLPLCHHTDHLSEGSGGFRSDLDAEEAHHIALEEPSLIFIDIEDDE